MSASTYTSSSPHFVGSAELRAPRRLRRAIESIRKRLPEASDFGQLYELFHERIGGAPCLWEHSRRREHQLLFSMVVHISRQLRPGYEPHTSMLFDIGDTGFSHGVVMGNDALASVFHDEHVGMGLVAVCNPFDRGGLEYVRCKPVMFGHVHGAVIEPGGPAG
jgi:hypothetical protein